MTRLAAFLCVPLLAQAPLKVIPPKGIEIPAADRASLSEGLLRITHPHPDVRVFHKAIDWALRYDEFLNKEDVARANRLLEVAYERQEQLAKGATAAAWLDKAGPGPLGLVPLGYVSRIDGSVQPYGVVLPPTWSRLAPKKWRVDFWFHGRGETLNEIMFLTQRLTQAGEFTPPDTVVVHLYGRYCVANKFAGEIDLFEVLGDLKRRIPVDEDRMVVRGFSMGGAATWHIAAHHAGLWAAAAPGAGFAETAQYLKLTPDQIQALPAWEPKLWNWYDATAYAANFFNLPLVAYSGELDRQIQAAKVMESALAKEGLRMAHVIGPKTEHKYHPESKPDINRRIDALAARGRVAVPRKLRFTTHTLRYNEMRWLTVDALDEHWERARVEAEIREPNNIVIRTENVRGLTIDFQAAQFPFDPGVKPVVLINGQTVQTALAQTDLSWSQSFHRQGELWRPGMGLNGKRHGLQGPIDDAFLDRFVYVTPTGTPRDAATGTWIEREMKRSANQWRRLFRGEVPIKADREVTDADIASSNLILWGDPQSNAVLARIADKLPVPFEGGARVPMMIYPNPLNPAKYVVVNSGITFREEADVTNAKQIPMLPDWVVVDITEPAGPRSPGKFLAGGFFDEDWKVQPR
jgi:dienelactone hydrolase